MFVRGDYTVGWICAIETEYTAAQTFLDDVHTPPDWLPGYDTNHYTLGEITGHNVVMAVLPDGEYGTNVAASVLMNMISTFPNIKVGLLVGIGGGAPTQENDIRLGDIVVSSPGHGSNGVYQYDYGKTIQGMAFFPTGSLNQPSTVVRSAVAGLRSRYRRRGHHIDETIESILSKWPKMKDDFSRPAPESDRLFVSSFVHTGTLTCDHSCARRLDMIIARQPRRSNQDNPHVHHGTIASGNQLMKDALIRDRYANDKRILCFEMEAAGLMNIFPFLTFADELREAAKQGERQLKAHKRDIEALHEQRSKEQSELMRRHKLDMDQLHKASEAKSAREKADLVAHLEDQLNSQLSNNQASADAKVSSLQAELQRLTVANATREHEIDRLRATAQDSYNNNNLNSGNNRNSRNHNNSNNNNNNTINSGNTNSRTYNNFPSDPPPPPLPPKLLRVPPPAKHFLGRGMEEQRENQRRQVVYKQQLSEYYRKYGGG